MQEDAARRRRRGHIVQTVHWLLNAALAIAMLCVCLEKAERPLEPVAEQQEAVVCAS